MVDVRLGFNLVEMESNAPCEMMYFELFTCDLMLMAGINRDWLN